MALETDLHIRMTRVLIEDASAAAERRGMKLAALIRKQLMDLVEADERERRAKAA